MFRRFLISVAAVVLTVSINPAFGETSFAEEFSGAGESCEAGKLNACNEAAACDDGSGEACGNLGLLSKENMDFRMATRLFFVGCGHGDNASCAELKKIKNSDHFPACSDFLFSNAVDSPFMVSVSDEGYWIERRGRSFYEEKAPYGSRVQVGREVVPHRFSSDGRFSFYAPLKGYPHDGYREDAFRSDRSWFVDLLKNGDVSFERPTGTFGKWWNLTMSDTASATILEHVERGETISLTYFDVRWDGTWRPLEIDFGAFNFTDAVAVATEAQSQMKENFLHGLCRPDETPG